MKSGIHLLCALCVLSCLIGFWACKKESTAQLYPIPSNLQLLSSAYALGAATKVEIYAAANLYAGYNKLYLALYDSASNRRITQSQVGLTVTAVMTGSSKCMAPVENPAATANQNALFESAAVFVMPSAGSQAWNIDVHVQNNTAGSAGDAVVTSSVSPASPPRAYQTVALNDSSTLYICMAQPVIPQIGNNNFELVIYKQTSATAYVPENNYSVAFTPGMQGMNGMNSPNNVNPVSTGNGHYQGTVVFTMYGGWQINIHLSENGLVSDTSHYFDINL